MRLVAGVDSSTQSCKIVVRDADTGVLVREGKAAHPGGTEVHPDAWWEALLQALDEAGGLSDVSAVSVAGQQHGMVCLDDEGSVIRPALLWNDTRSSPAADDLVAELGGPAQWAQRVGSVPVASFTVTKLRWLAEHEPHHAKRVAAVCLPHDWLTWKLSGSSDVGDLVTDRSDASGTGYWSPTLSSYDDDLLVRALGHLPHLPRVLGPREPAGRTAQGALLGPGMGDNAAAALGLGAGPGDVVVSLGTSGVVTAVTDRAAADSTGVIAGFADATGRHLPLVCTLNAARVLDGAAHLLGVDHKELSRLALTAPPGADGLVMVPYLEGERTPDLPEATGSLLGLTLATMTPAHLARASVEGMVAALADGLDVLADLVTPSRVLLIGGAAASPAVQTVAPGLFAAQVAVPSPAEYVAAGACRQAAWMLAESVEPPSWQVGELLQLSGEQQPVVRARYAQARTHFLPRC